MFSLGSVGGSSNSTENTLGTHTLGDVNGATAANGEFDLGGFTGAPQPQLAPPHFSGPLRDGPFLPGLGPTMAMEHDSGAEPPPNLSLQPPQLLQPQPPLPPLPVQPPQPQPPHQSLQPPPLQPQMPPPPQQHPPIITLGPEEAMALAQQGAPLPPPPLPPPHLFPPPPLPPGFLPYPPLVPGAAVIPFVPNFMLGGGPGGMLPGGFDGDDGQYQDMEDEEEELDEEEYGDYDEGEVEEVQEEDDEALEEQELQEEEPVQEEERFVCKHVYLLPREQVPLPGTFEFPEYPEDHVARPPVRSPPPPPPPPRRPRASRGKSGKRKARAERGDEEDEEDPWQGVPPCGCCMEKGEDADGAESVISSVSSSGAACCSRFSPGMSSTPNKKKKKKKGVSKKKGGGGKGKGKGKKRKLQEDPLAPDAAPPSGPPPTSFPPPPINPVPVHPKFKGSHGMFGDGQVGNNNDDGAECSCCAPSAPSKTELKNFPPQGPPEEAPARAEPPPAAAVASSAAVSDAALDPLVLTPPSEPHSESIGEANNSQHDPTPPHHPTQAAPSAATTAEATTAATTTAAATVALPECSASSSASSSSAMSTATTATPTTLSHPYPVPTASATPLTHPRCPREIKRPRTIFSDSQCSHMRAVFNRTPYLTKESRAELAETLNISPETIAVRGELLF